MQPLMNELISRIQDGTTFGGSDLCATCRFAMRRKGASTGFSETRCAALGNTPIVPVKIASCSTYLEKGRLTLQEMENVAWVIEQRGKHIGFLSPEELERRRINQLPANSPIGF